MQSVFAPMLCAIAQLSYLFLFSAASRPVAASQEMVALGCCQTLGSFVGSMPVTASFGRSAVNAASGARTTFGGIVTGELNV